MKVTVVQIGARMHYAIPRMLEEEDLLHALYTDIYFNGFVSNKLRSLPGKLFHKSLRKCLSRYSPNLSNRKVHTFPIFTIEYALKRLFSDGNITKIHLWAGSSFCSRILGKANSWNSDVLYTFNSAGLEIMKAAKTIGMKVVMEQTIAPRAIEYELMTVERSNWASWCAIRKPNDQDEHDFIMREEAEWKVADNIICASSFVKNGILSRNADIERKIEIIPYGVEVNKKNRERVASKLRPLRVLTVGSISLRKGHQYIYEAAKILKEQVEFKIVGGSDVSQFALSKLSEVSEIIGSVPRNEVERWYTWADVFLLPSICEGSATVIYEAMSYGLPIICTPNAGSIVEDNLQGFIIPIRDSVAIASAIEKFISDRTLLNRMSKSSYDSIDSISYQSYKYRLLNFIKAMAE